MYTKTLVVLPAFNVGGIIGDVISLLPKKHTLIIDDGSQDDTFNVVKKLGYMIIQHSSNLGVSAAIRTGEKYGIDNGYTHILLMDSDGQHPSELSDVFLSELCTADFVLGDRFSQLACVPPQKIASNLFASLLIQEITGVFIRDVSCGYRGYRLTSQSSKTVLTGYTEIYAKIIELTSAGIMPIRVLIPAIYNTEEPLATKCSEILALCSALSIYSSNPLSSHIANLVNEKTNIALQIAGISFKANYIENWASYVFSTDLQIAEKIYGN